MFPPVASGDTVSGRPLPPYGEHPQAPLPALPEASPKRVIFRVTELRRSRSSSGIGRTATETGHWQRGSGCCLCFAGFRAVFSVFRALDSRFPQAIFRKSASGGIGSSALRKLGKPAAEDVAVKRPRAEEPAGALRLFSMEPVSGFEPLTIRLQGGRSAN